MSMQGLLTALLVLFAAGQVYVIRQQRLLAELQVVHELREQWLRVRDEWIGMLVLGGHFYLDIPPAVSSKYPVLEDDRISKYRELVHFNRDKRNWTEIQAALDEDEKRLLSHGGPLEFPEEFHRLPLGLLATVCAYILRSRLTVGSAYEVFGADLTRNSSSVRYVTDAAPSSTYYLHYYPGVRRRVLVLLDLMWAEAATRGDLNHLEAAKAADTKKKWKTGLRNRQRLRAEARRLSRFLPPWRLEWRLTAAEVRPDTGGLRRRWRRLLRWVGGLRTFRGSLYPERSPWT